MKFAFFHYPLHADSSSQGSDTYLGGTGGLEGLLAANHVSVVFNGHAHIYERNLPQIPGSPMVSYVTGGGGAALGTVDSCSGFDAYAIGSGSSCRAPKPTSNSHVYEFLLVTVNGNQVTVTPTDSTGQTFDRQTYTFGTPPPTSDFSIAATPTSVSVRQGSAGSSTISTAVTSGSAQTVALSATGAPSGTSVSFNPATVTAGQSSTMTVTTSTTTPLGSSTLMVTGTGTSVTHTVPLGLTVTAVGGGPALVQSTGAAESSPSTALTGTFPTATVSGHLLVLSASVYTGATNRISSVSDSAGNAWTRIGSYYVSGHYSDGEMWFAANAKPVTSVTVHMPSAATVSFAVQEYSGIRTTSPLGTSAGASNTSITANSGSAASTVTDSLVVGFVAGHGNAQVISVTSPGFTVLPQRTSSGTAASVVAGYAVAGTPGPQSFTASFGTAMYWAAGVAVFSP